MDCDAQRWRQIASLSSLPQNAPASDTKPSGSLSATIANGPAAAPPSLADKLCYGCLVPFLEAQGKARPVTSAEDHKPFQALLPAYTADLLADRPANQDSNRADPRKEIENFLL